MSGPVEEPLPERTTGLPLQSTSWKGSIAATTLPAVWVTVTVTVSAQPLAGLVAMKAYWPAASTVGVRVVCPETMLPFAVSQR